MVCTIDPYSGDGSFQPLFYIPPANRGSVAIVSRGGDLSGFGHSNESSPEQGCNRVGTELVHLD